MNPNKFFTRQQIFTFKTNQNNSFYNKLIPHIYIFKENLVSIFHSHIIGRKCLQQEIDFHNMDFQKNVFSKNVFSKNGWHIGFFPQKGKRIGIPPLALDKLDNGLNHETLMTRVFGFFAELL